MDASNHAATSTGLGTGKLFLLVAAIVAAAIATGIVLERTGAVDVMAEHEIDATFDAVPYSICPTEARLGDFHRGDRVYLTGRSSDGSWVEVRAPFDTSSRVWLEAQWITTDHSIDQLPSAECTGLNDNAVEPIEDATPSPTSESPTPSVPSSDATTTSPSTSTAGTAAPTTTPATSPTNVPPPNGTPAPPTTTTPDTTGPSIDLLHAEPTDIWEDANYGGCPTQPHVTTISVTVVDPSGVASVSLRSDTGSGERTIPMSSSGSNSYSATLGPYTDDEVTADRPVSLVVTALDTRSNSAVSSSSNSLILHNCAIG